MDLFQRLIPITFYIGSDPPGDVTNFKEVVASKLRNISLHVHVISVVIVEFSTVGVYTHIQSLF